jgi:hypothetical protein
MAFGGFTSQSLACLPSLDTIRPEPSMLERSPALKKRPPLLVKQAKSSHLIR